MTDGVQYTIYFKWCAEGTPWGPDVVTWDEEIFDLVLEHDEGQIPTCTIEVINPRTAFINPTAAHWCWITFARDACAPQALFYGRLVGIPEEIEKNTVKMKFIARSSDYMYQKQHVAETLKLLPNYDPIFFDVLKRDDPDSILEGWSALYHVDRVTASPPLGRVTASDILQGEDGTVTFHASDVFYDSVQCKILQSPLAAVNVKADVQWEQQFRGEFNVGQWAWPTLGGDAFVGQWPKSGTDIGKGWWSGTSWAGERDPDPYTAALKTMKPTQPTYSIKWTNQAKHHEYGDTMSVDIQYTPPYGKAIVMQQVNQVGILNPYAVDANGDPAPVNIPAFNSIDWFCYKQYDLNFLGKQSLATLELVYQANRKRSERVEITVKANVQPVLIDPLVIEDTEQISMKSGDLSLPMINLLNWDSVAGGAVALGTIIFPDNPQVPGQTSSQIAVTAGTAGTTEPVFSNIAGATTQDGSVTWASLGDTPPTEGAQDWDRDLRVPLGTLLIPKPVMGVPSHTCLIAPGQLSYPPTGVPCAKYTIFAANGGGPGAGMMQCSASGMVGGLGPQASFINFGNPTGAFLYIAIQAGQTGDFRLTFNEGLNTQTPDGSVIWQCLGPVTVPIGGWPGQTPANTYFPSDRGLQSLQHMLCRARAKLRKRARAVQVSFNTRFEVGALLNCRMNGTLTDVRLPGGTVTGKVISYKLEAHGETGEWIAHVTLGCSVGESASAAALRRGLPAPQAIVVDPGVPSYVGVAGPNNGYVKTGYQQYYATGTTFTPGEPGYVPPGTLPTQPAPIAIPSNPVGIPPGSPPGTTPGLPPGFTPAPPPATTAPPSTASPAPPDPPGAAPAPPMLTCSPLSSTWTSGGGPSGAGNEIGYTPPQADPNDDGLTYPLNPAQVILGNAWHGIPSTMNPVSMEIYNLEIEQAIHDAIYQAKAAAGVIPQPPMKPIGVPVDWISPEQLYDAAINAQVAVLTQTMQGEGLWYELVLRPLTNGPFANYYVVSTTNLDLPQGIDLSAPSSGGILSHA